VNREPDASGEPVPTPEQQAVGRALARIPSGLFVMTAGRGAEATGMLVSWVQQVGFEPPALTVALRKGRPFVDLVRRERAFCIAVLDESGRALMRHFARGFAPGRPAFEGIAIADTPNGVPRPTAAQAWLACRMLGEADWSDHVVVCGEVVAGDGRLDALPLLHVRRDGFSY
jgi:flavin reductase (DIM6/NTAB) family NADH-FMN oxidoreductase RutF